MTNNLRPLSDYGIVRTEPGQYVDDLWTVTLTGGVNAFTFRFDAEPEHRALEELMEHLGQTSAAVIPPTQGRIEAGTPADELVAAVMANPDVAQLAIPLAHVAAVIAALGGVNTKALLRPFVDGEQIEVRVPDYSGDGVDSDGDYCWVPADFAAMTPSGDVVAHVEGGDDALAFLRTDARPVQS